nr:MAG TPA: hypothetical protein [Bacteriophage sp.]
MSSLYVIKFLINNLYINALSGRNIEIKSI